MVVYEKIYFEAYTNDHYIYYKNNITQLYFTIGTAKIYCNFSSSLSNAPDIYRFPVEHIVKNHFCESLKCSYCILMVVNCLLATLVVLPLDRNLSLYGSRLSTNMFK